jgi:hypothetical protein
MNAQFIEETEDNFSGESIPQAALSRLEFGRLKPESLK